VYLQKYSYNKTN